MNKYTDKLELHSILVIVSFCILFIGNCSNNRNINNVHKQNESLVQKVDSLQRSMTVIADSSVSKNEMQILLEIEGYKSSARNLYHQNYIVRTKERPDDIIFQYNQKIETLSKQLK
jgi:hypothetical protein